MGPVLLSPQLVLLCSCSNCAQINAKTLWYINGKVLTNNSTLAAITHQSSNGQIKFLKSSPLLAGSYRCVVSSTCGTSSIPLIGVHFTNFVKSSVILTKLEGESAAIICNTANGLPEGIAHYSIESLNPVNSRYIFVSDRLIIPNLVKSDSGFYRCKITTDSYSEYTETIGLIVHTNANLTNRQPAISFPKSEYVFRILKDDYPDIKCAFDGRPDPTIVYYNLSGDQVNRENMQNNHEYMCIGTNLNVFSDKRRFRVSIEEKPSGHISNYQQVVYEGQKYTFNLSVNGKPTPNISWFLGYSMLPAVGELDDTRVQITFSVEKGPHLVSFMLRNVRGTYFKSYGFSVKPHSLVKQSNTLSNNLVFIITFGIIGFLLLILLIVTILRVKSMRRTPKTWEKIDQPRSHPERFAHAAIPQVLRTDQVPDMYDMMQFHQRDQYRHCNI